MKENNNQALNRDAEKLVRSLRSSPKLWKEDSSKIDGVLKRAMSRAARRRECFPVPMTKEQSEAWNRRYQQELFSTE